MKKYTDLILYTLLSLCLIGLAVLARPETFELALQNQTLLLGIAEATVYFAAAFLMVAIALWFKAKRNHENILGMQSGQQLEFITRRFEQEFRERSHYDPRGAGPVPAPVNRTR